MSIKQLDLFFAGQKVSFIHGNKDVFFVAEKQDDFILITRIKDGRPMKIYNKKKLFKAEK